MDIKSVLKKTNQHVERKRKPHCANSIALLIPRALYGIQRTEVVEKNKNPKTPMAALPYRGVHTCVENQCANQEYFHTPYAQRRRWR